MPVVNVLKTVPAGVCPAMSALCVRSKRIGYSATKKMEKTPATTASADTQLRVRTEARRRLSQAISEEESVGMECVVRASVEVRTSESGRMPMRHRLYRAGGA